jgi:Flp pilus assembly protein TadD
VNVRAARLATLVLACAALVGAAPAWANADLASPAPENADFELGRQAVQAKDWPTARYHLEIAAKAEPTNADVRNLLGFTMRNLKDYPAALRFYGEALALDPNHRGAHEYIGETYLLTGDKARAREHLAALERICGRSCEEYADLARAIAKAQ